MRWVFILMLVSVPLQAADLESRALTTYLPQDMLETVVRKEGWTEVALKPYGGVKKGDIVRIWAGGMVDRGGDQPGQNVAGPAGLRAGSLTLDPGRLALASNPGQAYALLFKTDNEVPHACQVPGKALEIPLPKEGARLWLGFND